MGKPLSPPINATEVGTISDVEFYGVNDTYGLMGKWVADAQSEGYTSSGEFLQGGRRVTSFEEGGEEEASLTKLPSRKVLRRPSTKSRHLEDALGNLKSMKKHEIKSLLDELQDFYDDL